MTVDGYEYNDVFIDGSFCRTAVADRLPAVNPATEEQFGSAPDLGREHVDAAVQAAKRALRSSEWAGLDASARARLLRRLAEIFHERQDEIAGLITQENGMVLGGAKAFNVFGSALRFSYFADMADSWSPEESRPAVAPAGAFQPLSGAGSFTAPGGTGGTSPDTMGKGAYTIVRQEPIGVVGIIVPWNVPLSSIAVKLGAALAAGCTAVIKPAPETSLDTVLLAEAIVEAGFPPGVVNIVTGADTAGIALVEHPDVNMIAFTGSSAVGREIARVCGGMLKRATLELGGKSAAIVLEDADLELLAANLPTCSLGGYSGQSCRASTRILAPRSRYEEVVDAVASALDALPIGDPLDPNTVVGPVASKAQYDRVQRYLTIGKEEGARVALGGGRPPGIDRGYYIAPTVFADVNNQMRIAREEIFGPVLAVIPYEGEDEAVAIANDSDYGLGGTVWTQDAEHGTDIARRVETGTIGVNTGGMPPLNSPFGGVKGSGIGREMGPEGFSEYLVPKSIVRVS